MIWNTGPLDGERKALIMGMGSLMTCLICPDDAVQQLHLPVFLTDRGRASERNR